MAKWGGRRTQRLFAAVLQRDHISGKGWRCVLCKGITKDVKLLSLEHVVPRSQGGSDAMRNLAIACRSCNSSRGDKPMDSWRDSIADRVDWVNGLV